jgi:hypothetical protein
VGQLKKRKVLIVPLLEPLRPKVERKMKVTDWRSMELVRLHQQVLRF